MATKTKYMAEVTDTYAQAARDFIALSVRIDRMRRDVPSLVEMVQS